MEEVMTLVPDLPNDDFWNTLHELRKRGELCDIELNTQNDMCPAHKLVLVASSDYFRQAYAANDLRDSYNLDGTNSASLELILDYVYHQKTWEELEQEPLAKAVADALGIDKRADTSPGMNLLRNMKGSKIMVVPVGSQREKPKTSERPKAAKRIFVQNTSEAFRMSMEQSRAEKQRLTEFHNVTDYDDENLVSMEESLPSQETSISASELNLLAEASSSVNEIGDNNTTVIILPTAQTELAEETVDVKVEACEMEAEDSSQNLIIHLTETSERDENDTAAISADNASLNTEIEEKSSPLLLRRSVRPNRGIKREIQEPLKLKENTLTIVEKEPNQKESIVDISGSAAAGDKTIERYCEKCDRLFTTAQGLAVHIGWAHNEVGTGHSIDTAECPECKMTFKGRCALSKHMSRTHKSNSIHQCSVSGCEETFSHIRTMRKHLSDVHRLSSFFCKECNITFKSPEGLRFHMTKFHNNNPEAFTCDICNKVFTVKTDLKRHIRITHSETFDYKCTICTRAFKTSSSLRRHINTFHSAQLCDSSFKTSGCLSKHRSLHFRAVNPLVSGRKSMSEETANKSEYECKYCGKVFKKFGTYKSHVYKVHEAKEEGNLYECSICKKTFTVKAYLQQHILAKHQPKRYQCETCGIGFTQRYLLNRHAPRCKCIPKALKPFHCITCGASFLNKRNLQIHIRKQQCEKVIQKNMAEEERVDFVIYSKEEVIETDEPDDVKVEKSIDTADNPSAETLEIIQLPDGDEQFIKIGDKLLPFEQSEEGIVIQDLNPSLAIQSSDVIEETGEEYVFQIVDGKVE